MPVKTKASKRLVMEEGKELSRAWKFGDDIDTDAIIPGQVPDH